MGENEKVVVKQLAKEILEEMKKKTVDRRLHNTRLLMKNYTKLKQHVDDVTGEIDISDFDCDSDLEDEKVFLRSMIRTKIRTAKMLGCIDEALQIIYDDLDNQGELRKYTAFEMHFVDKATNEEIVAFLNCGTNSPRKWSNEIINQLSILLWGIDALTII